MKKGPAAVAHETNNRLSALAGEIRAAHDALQRSAEVTAERALSLGTLLVEAKDKVKHGEWSVWLAANTTISDRSARGYMQLARSGAKTATVAEIGLRASLAALSRRADDESTGSRRLSPAVLERALKHEEKVREIIRTKGEKRAQAYFDEITRDGIADTHFQAAILTVMFTDSHPVVQAAAMREIFNSQPESDAESLKNADALVAWMSQRFTADELQQIHEMFEQNSEDEFFLKKVAAHLHLKGRAKSDT